MLDLPLVQAVHSIVAGHVAAASEALDRLQSARDREALHDFRVALRRLRSVLRWYRPWIGRAGGRGVRRRLRRLVAATSAARDAEVQLEWLARRCDEVPRDARPALNALLRDRRAAIRRGLERTKRRGRRIFPDLARKIELRFRETGDRGPVLRDVFSSLLERGTGKLEANLAAISGANDAVPLHEARIAAKRLRYLLEPLEPELSPPAAAAEAIGALENIQDVLGGIHDLQLLDAALAGDSAAERPSAAGGAEVCRTTDAGLPPRKRSRREELLDRLRADAGESRDLLFAGFESDRDGGRLAALLDALRDLSRRSAPPSSAGHDPGLALTIP